MQPITHHPIDHKWPSGLHAESLFAYPMPVNLRVSEKFALVAAASAAPQTHLRRHGSLGLKSRMDLMYVLSVGCVTHTRCAMTLRLLPKVT